MSTKLPSLPPTQSLAESVAQMVPDTTALGWTLDKIKRDMAKEFDAGCDGYYLTRSELAKVLDALTDEPVAEGK